MNDDDYVALVEEVETLIRDHSAAMSADTRLHHDEDLWNEPGLSISALLWDDLEGVVQLPDETVARLWEIGYALGYEGEFLVSDDGLAKAREGRRTRPPQPVRFPLKGGGHGAGRGIPGKTEYPARWPDDDAMSYVMDVAREPDGAVQQPDGTFRAWGVRDGVALRVVVTELGSVDTAYPVSGNGVVTNPLDDLRRPYVARLQALAAATPMDDEARAGVEELLAVGEWDHVVRHLRALSSPDAQELEQLAKAAGLPDRS